MKQHSCPFAFLPARTRGFTLVELAIVLVVIGLIVGGVLVGTDLIDAANMRKDYGLTESHSASVNAFKLKYNYLPGDIPNASIYGFNANSSGNGDGKIQGIISSYSNLYTSTDFAGLYAEWFRVYHHLATAGMVDFNGSYTTASSTTNLVAGTYYPLMSTNGGLGNTSDSTQGAKSGMIISFENTGYVQAHYFRFGAIAYNGGGNPMISFQGGFTAARAKRFDTKFDDGKPVSGAIQIGPLNDQCSNDVYDTTGACGFGGISTSGTWYHCALLSTMDYDVSYGPRSCSLRVKASF